MNLNLDLNSNKKPWHFRVLLWILFLVCRGLSFTWRIKIVGMDRRRLACNLSKTGSILLASFHENASAGVLTHSNQNIAVMVSRSKDGEIVAFISQKIGLSCVRGSSSRGAKEVRNEMVQSVLSGAHGAITVDGPRGPRRVLKPGIIDIASKTGAPIVPITCIGERFWVLRKTWDQTRIPKPFSRVIVHYGEPVVVPRSLTKEDFNQLLQDVTLRMERDDDFVRIRFQELCHYLI